MKGGKASDMITLIILIKLCLRLDVVLIMGLNIKRTLGLPAKQQKSYTMVRFPPTPHFFYIKL